MAQLSRETNTSPSRSLDRVGQVLEQITRSREGCTLAELQTQTAIPRSSLYTLVGSLVAQDMVRREAGGRFVAGPALVRWGARVIQWLDLRDVARPWMVTLAKNTGFVVNLAEIDDDRRGIIFLAKEQCGEFHTTAQVGSRMPMHSTALGKILLAHAPMEWRGRYLAEVPLVARTAATITKPRVLAEELERVREQGWSEDHQENEVGVCAIAAPIRNYTGHVVAALSVALPDQGFEQWRPAVISQTVEAARAISRELGAEG